MIQWIFLLITFTFGFPLFSKDVDNYSLQEWQEEALLRFDCGNAHLFVNEPWQALEEFQKAHACLDPSDSSAGPLGFIITFSQVIAYDCLGFHEHCKQALGSLFLTISKWEDEENSLAQEECDKATNEDSKTAIQFFHDLVTLSPSFEVRQLLFSIVDDLAEELLPSFQFADALTLGGDLLFSNSSNNYSINLSKSFWKKCKKWCKKIGDWIETIAEVLKKAKEAKQIYDDYKKQQENNNVNYRKYRNYHYIQS